MSAGWDDGKVGGPNVVRNILLRPLAWEPGSKWFYDNGSAHLVSAVLTRATGMSAAEYAQRRLFGPLNIQPLEWPADPQGNSSGSAVSSSAPASSRSSASSSDEAASSGPPDRPARSWAEASTAPTSGRTIRSCATATSGGSATRRRRTRRSGTAARWSPSHRASTPWSSGRATPRGRPTPASSCATTSFRPHEAGTGTGATLPSAAGALARVFRAMSYAIISLGGKQYRVQEGDRLRVDRVATEEGKTLNPVGAPLRRRQEDRALAEGRHRDRTGRRAREGREGAHRQVQAPHRLQAAHRLPRLADGAADREDRRPQLEREVQAAPKAEAAKERPRRRDAEGLRGA